MTEAEWDGCADPQAMLDWLRGRGLLTPRKARLYAVACVRQVAAALRAEEQHRLLEAAEGHADGKHSATDLVLAHVETLEWDGLGLPCGESDPSQAAARAAPESWHLWETHLRTAHGEAERLWREARDQAKLLERGRRRSPHGHGVSQAAYDLTLRAATDASVAASEARERVSPAGLRAERDRLDGAAAGLLRCLFGPLPFREVRPDPAWLAWDGAAVGRMAGAAYEERELPSGRLDLDRLAILGDALEEAGCQDQTILAHLRERGAIHVRGCWVIDLLLGKS